MSTHPREELPRSYEEAMADENQTTWNAAIKEELEALVENNTWQAVSLSSAKRTLTTKWVFSVKRDGEGRIVKLKARLVVRGFEQSHGVDFFQTFAPVARLESIRTLLAVGAATKRKMVRFDISTAFLNGVIGEEVFIEPPQGYQIDSGSCLRLRKALYGLKQAPRAWNSTFDSALKALDFNPTLSDQCVYIHKGLSTIVVVYVDDGIILADTEQECVRVLDSIKAQFKLRRLDGSLFLGIEIEYKDGIYLTQSRYIKDIVDRFNLGSANEVSSLIAHAEDLLETDEPEISAPYRQALGCLQYLACYTRPDIASSTDWLSQFDGTPRSRHWTAVKRVIKYLKGTSDLGIFIEKMKE